MRFLYSLSVLLLISVFQVHAQEERVNSAPWFGPTSLPLKASVEEGVNFQLVGGAFFGHGQGRDHFFDADEWQYGWISRLPWIEIGFSFAPTSEWEFGLQIPYTLLSSTINFHHSMNENFGAGVKVGLFSSAYLSISYEPTPNFFVTLSPAVGINQFGAPKGARYSASDRINESALTLGGQLSLGIHRDPADHALLVAYDYAIDGDGVENSFIFDDILMRHFLKVAVAIKF